MSLIQVQFVTIQGISKSFWSDFGIHSLFTYLLFNFFIEQQGYKQVNSNSLQYPHT